MKKIRPLLINNADKAELPSNKGLGTELDTYVLLQGPAHILIEADSNSNVGTISVAFLDDAGNRKPSINLAFKTEENTRVIKALFLNLLIECDKAKYGSGELNAFFPKIFNEVIKTSVNMPDMTSTGPPTGNGSN